MPYDLAPGATIGILGGGQLGRMLAVAAAKLGLKTHVYAEKAESPALDVASSRTVAAFEDRETLAAFASSVDLITYEFENIPFHTASFLASLNLTRPSPATLAICQDRLREKEFLASVGAEFASYARVDDAGALARAVAQVGRQSILKTRRSGYDGKGQILLREGADLAVIFRALGGVPAILESIVPFEMEISVVAARGPDSSFAAYDVAENIHENQILKSTRVPARLPPEISAAAVQLTRRIAEALEYSGVLAVEMFVVRNGERRELRVNEIAPRVHNSGHWTLDGAVTSQFEQHVRAIAGWPLGETGRLRTQYGEYWEMKNLIGEDVLLWPEILAERNTHLHLYGKAEIRAGRKMGHFTRIIDPD